MAHALVQSYYVHHYEKLPIDSNTILFESKHGKDLGSNVFRLLQGTVQGYSKYRVCLTCVRSQRERTSQTLERYHISNVTLLDPHSLEYFKTLASAKYLFTDTTLPTRYIKKEGQVVVNTWHGTPLKYMGRDDTLGAYAMGNVQRNFLLSDYLLYPNDYMQQKMLSAYALNGVYQGTILNEGYPRNCVFFQPDPTLKRSLNLEGKSVYVYMPTWRGSVTSRGGFAQTIDTYLSQLDTKLTDEQVLIAKLHSFVDNTLDYSKYRHIVPMPQHYDPYELLNLADCLVTDYSSVLYDFANTGRKIVLFTYDETEYLQERGIYTPLSELPFPKVYDVETLYQEMVSPKAYDDTQFRKLYCTYDDPHATENILKHVLEGKAVCKTCQVLDTSKENVLTFGGNLAKNGITTAMVNLLNHVDTSKRRYYVTFQQDTLKPDPLRVLQIPNSVNVFPMPTKPQYTPLEALAMVLYYRLNLNFALKYVDRLCKREVRHLFTGLEVSKVVQYEGYGKNMVHLFKHFDCPKSIFVHNNMVEELSNKNIQHRKTLEVAYQTYDYVACVTKDLLTPTESISHSSRNLVVVNNYHDYRTVIEKSKLPLRFDVDTISNVSLERLTAILDSNATKVVNIGRFSPEKGHDMLIHAFESFAQTHLDTYLIIIGGYGEEYPNTLALATSSPVSDRIIVIKSMSNPMPILAHCDLFVLSSRYEGLGLTLLEADTLGIPTISTDVCGASGFMREQGGHLVEVTVEGIRQGLEDFTQGKVSAMHVDFETYNHNAIAQFESIVDR